MAKAKDEAPTPPVPPRLLRLESLEAARRTMARLVRLYDRGEIPTEKFRAECYGMSTLLAFFRVETDAEILRRVEALEERIEREVQR